MGTSRTPGQLARKISQLPATIEKATHDVVKHNAAMAKRNAEAELRRATQGSMRLSNAGALIRAGDSRRVVGRKGAALRVSTKPESAARVLVSAEGPWQLLENPTKGHFIGPAGVAKTAVGSKSGRGAKARQGRAKALRTPYGIKRWVYTGGTKGKKPWRRAFDKTQRQVADPSRKLIVDAIRKAL